MSEIIAEESQAKEATRKLKARREDELSDIRQILSLPAGKRFLHRLLAHCGIHQSVWHPSAAIHKYAGIQEVGHFIFGECVAADRAASAQLLVESYEREMKGKP